MWVGNGQASKSHSATKHLALDYGDPYGNRTRVSAVKGPRPGPLDEGAAKGPEGSLRARAGPKEAGGAGQPADLGVSGRADRGRPRSSVAGRCSAGRAGSAPAGRDRSLS